jgi:5-methylcytosine-specific restriction endonuclease McrA
MIGNNKLDDMIERQVEKIKEEKIYNFIRAIENEFDIMPCSRCGEIIFLFDKVTPNFKSVRIKCYSCDKYLWAKAKISNNLSTVNFWTQLKRLEEVHNFILSEVIYLKQNENSDFLIHYREKELKQTKGKRKYIPEEVRHEVWRRDRGRCVQCGSQEKLEFDHIIPVSKGGSSTARNLQLLCERCNRSKGADI